MFKKLAINLSGLLFKFKNLLKQSMMLLKVKNKKLFQIHSKILIDQ